MTAGPVDLLALAHRRPLTIADLPADDGVGRTELIDGSLFVTPPGDVDHQILVAGLVRALEDTVPDGCLALPGVNVIGGDDTLVIPDVAVIDPEIRVRHGLGVPPDAVLLAVEVTSPSTRRTDLTTKRHLYETWGVPFVVLDRTGGRHRYQVHGDLPGWGRVILPRD